VLVPAAIILVPFAIFLLVHRWGDKGGAEAIHPLESIQDDGLYRDYQEGKRLEVISPLEELPKDRPPMKLGETRRFGGLEVTPLEVVRLKPFFSFYRGARNFESGYQVLGLRLRLKNVSEIVFHPHDPVFNRAHRPGVQPYSYLTIGERRFYGVVADPTSERVQGQNFSELLPGDEMETWFLAASDPSDRRAVEEVSKLPEDQTLVWRVQLRKGRENIRGRLVWATTIVPVEFRVGDIKTSSTGRRNQE